ncbi:MAG: hypothetical protein OEY11_10085 [Gammaproteobacteria bacterium]|nr:hypothetical protein [Gammaproteobacteria bacterium]
MHTVPRTVLAFYDSELDGGTADTEVHKSAEMSLNHLGLVVHYQDIHRPLPDKKAMADVRGVLLWLHWDTMPDPNQFLRWLINQMRAGKRVVIMGLHAFENSRSGQLLTADPELINQFWSDFGLTETAEWMTVNYNIQIQSTDKQMTDFERSLKGLLLPFPVKTVSGSGLKSYLKAYQRGREKRLADLIVSGPKGGYVAPGYSLISSRDGKQRFWYLNPFRFFRQAFATDDLPKADTTTLSGRRIYYSHVDGDGWRSLSLVPGYREKKKSVTEVLLREVFLKYPDLPVTVSPVAADLDSSWFGTKKNQALAKEIFALPHVEAGSHTLSHPMDWSFFEHYDADSERAYLHLYPETYDTLAYQQTQTEIKNSRAGASDTKTSALDSSLKSGSLSLSGIKQKLKEAYEIPRAYFKGLFKLEEEIQGSIDIIQRYLPAGKRVELLQWSGNLPFSAAIKQTRVAGIRNLNGGDTRFDREFDSYAWVSPIGREVNKQRQIYASSSNENTYTRLWTSRFYGYGYLEKTLRATETPWRIKPINVYYHNYSGERLASLNALHKNFAYARSQSIAPVTASRFAAIADGFFSTVFEHIGKRQWRIKNRDQLQTIRFDHATFDAVDFKRSKGVIGQSHLHGSLYVQLDPVVSAPVIALRKIKYSDRQADAKRPYLISGRWWTDNVELTDKGFQCQVQGFGAGNMHWYMPDSGQYRISVELANGQTRQWQTSVGDNHWLQVVLEEAPVKAFFISVEKLQEANASS